MSSTPAVAKITESTRPSVSRSCRRKQPKITIKAGVAAVTSAPVCADVSIVPVSWTTILRRYPEKETMKRCFQSFRSILKDCFVKNIMQSSAISAVPKRIQTSSMGGMTATAMRTAMNIPPQMAPASERRKEPITRLRNISSGKNLYIKEWHLYPLFIYQNPPYP